MTRHERLHSSLKRVVLAEKIGRLEVGGVQLRSILRKIDHTDEKKVKRIASLLLTLPLKFGGSINTLRNIVKY